MRMVIVAAGLTCFALAAEAAISRASPEAAIEAAYSADALAVQSSGFGVMSDPIARSRFFSRSLLKSMDADAAASNRDPLKDGAPRVVDLRVAPISEKGGSAKVLAEFARGDGSRERVTYALVFERGAWRVDDIDYTLFDGESHRLRGPAAR